MNDIWGLFINPNVGDKSIIDIYDRVSNIFLNYNLSKKSQRNSTLMFIPILMKNMLRGGSEQAQFLIITVVFSTTTPF